MTAAFAFVPPAMMALAYAAYQKVFSEEDRIKHTLLAGIAWQRVKQAFGTRRILESVEVKGLRDDDTFFAVDATDLFMRFWKEKHAEKPFREAIETVLEALQVTREVIRCEIRFSYWHGLDEVDQKPYEATYLWCEGDPPRLLAFPVYPEDKTDVVGVVLLQKVLAASLEDDTGRPEKVVTDTILRLAGPRGNFYQDVPEIHRPEVNWSLTFWEEPYCYLKLVDSFGLTYRYDLRTEFVAKWPTDAVAHLVY